MGASDEDYEERIEREAQKHVGQIEQEVSGMTRVESSLHLREKVGDLEQEYVILQKEYDQIEKKQMQAEKMQMGDSVTGQLEKAMEAAEEKMELKELQMNKLNNMLQEAEFYAR